MEQQSEIYKPLGKRTFIIFLLQRISAISFFIAAAMICVVVIRVMPAYASFLYEFVLGIIIAGIITIGIMFWAAYVMYVRYGITLAPDSLKITRGFITQEEIGIPYRGVKDVRIERDIVDQAVGVSDIFIDTVEGVGGSASSVVLRAIEKNLAVHIQDEIVKRAEIEKVRVQPSALI